MQLSNTNSQLTNIAFWGIICRVTGLAIGLATSIILARTLGPELFGQYAFLLTAAELLTILVLFGTPALILREVATGTSTGSFGKVRGLLSWTCKSTCLLSIPVLIGAMVLLFFWQKGQTPSVAFSVLFVSVSFILIDARIRQGVNVIQGLNKVLASQVLSILTSPPFFLAVLVGLYFFSPGSISLLLILSLLLFSRIFALLIIERKKKQYLPWEVLLSKPEYHTSQWLHSALPLLLVGSLLIINTRIDIIMLGYLREAGDVGLYRVAQRGGQYMLFGIMSIDSIINPLAARAMALNQKEHLQKVVSKSIWLALIFTLPLLGVYIFFGQDLINFVYGQDFNASWQPLIILSCGYLSLIILGRGGVILTMSHFERDTAKAIGIGAGANIILNLLLIPHFGINGAAMGTALAVTIRMVMEALFAYQKTGINTTILPLIFNRKKT